MGRGAWQTRPSVQECVQSILFNSRQDCSESLADEYSIRSPAKLQRQALLEGVRVSIREAQEALKTDLGRQVFGPKPRSRGKSAAEGPNDRLQFDLIDYAANTSKNNPNRYALTGIDVFTREMASVPLKSKKPSEVNEAFKKTVRELVGDETNYVVTTDQGNEFAGLSSVLPDDAIHWEKTPEDKNAIAEVDRGMQSLQKDLASTIGKKAGSPG